MGPRLVHYSDVENALDRPERVGRLAGTIERVRTPPADAGEAARTDASTEEAIVVGTGDDTAPGALALEREGLQALPFFERVRPDAETFGNHDFDFGLAATREVVAGSAVPWVSANVRHDGERFAGVDPARVVERGGDRVALVGVTGPDVSLPPDLEVADPVESVRDAWDGLRREADDEGVEPPGSTPDWLVVLAHTADATARELARETPADAVLAGHVHSVTRERVDGTPLVRPGDNGRVVWEVELGAGDADSANEGAPRGVTATRHDNRGVTATRHEVPEGPLDEGVAAALRAEKADAGLTEVVETLDGPVPRDRAACLRGECALANLATDALRWVADADLAHVDARGLRDGPDLGPEVAVGDLVGIAPFAAGVFVATVPTADVLALVGESVHPDGTDGRDAEVWTGQFAGLELRRDRAAGETRVGIVDGGTTAADGTHLGTVTDDGACRVATRRELRLATNGYVVSTDEFEAVGPADVRELHGLQYEAFVAYARAVDLDPGRDGRIAFAGE